MDKSERNTSLWLNTDNTNKIKACPGYYEIKPF
jgi:hypothetical protein